jgi:hypothetical protein
LELLPHEWWRLAEAILASGGLLAKRRPSASAIRHPSPWAEGSVGLHLFFEEEAARHSVYRGRGSFLYRARNRAERALLRMLVLLVLGILSRQISRVRRKKLEVPNSGQMFAHLIHKMTANRLYYPFYVQY